MTSEHILARARLNWLPTAVVTALLIAIMGGMGAAVFVASGLYNIGADAPHTKPVFWLIGQLRDRSIAAHAQGLKAPPDIADARRVNRGAMLYASLCVTCHAGPGVKRTDLSRGLYPKPPPLAYGNTLSPGEEFWIIKHGVKLTAMPAWGKTHDDDQIWSLVSFLQAMPNLSPEQYQATTATSQPQSGAGR
jgi:mono/diheme cytochrome c family protein